LLTVHVVALIEDDELELRRAGAERKVGIKLVEWLEKREACRVLYDRARLRGS